MDRGEHILVVEDEQDLADVVRVNLELSGYQVTVAEDGAVGLDVARSQSPDLVLLDVMMPVLDGWGVLRAMREDPALQDIPVILLTALSEEHDVIRGHLDGAIEYITKPFEMWELDEAVKRGLAVPDDEELAARRERVRHFLQRLAELDSGRSGDQQVRFSKLETRPTGRSEAAPTADERGRLDRLTENQRYIAEQLAAGTSARELSEELGVSRSNVYATRKRIARKLGVAPDEVTDELRRLGADG